MNTKNLILLALALFTPWEVVAESPAILQAGGNLSSLVLDCKPLYAVEDQRVPMSDLKQAHHQGQVFYLFSNRELAIWQVELFNNYLAPVAAVDPNSESWEESIELQVVSLTTGEIILASFKILEKKYSTTVLYRDAKPLLEFELEPSPGGGAARITTPHDRKERTYESLGRFPTELPPRSTFRVVVQLIFPEEFDGKALQLNFHDPTTGEDCQLKQVLVLGDPETQRDVVDDHLVRYRYYMRQDLLEAAEFEVEEATRKVPDSLTAWTYRASFAARSGKTEDLLASSLRIQELLSDLQALGSYDQFGVISAREFVRDLPKVRARLQRKVGDGSLEEP